MKTDFIYKQIRRDCSMRTTEWVKDLLNEVLRQMGSEKTVEQMASYDVMLMALRDELRERV